MTMSAAQAVRLASDHFAENLAFAFVGGSYARARTRPRATSTSSPSSTAATT